ncbi:hypothetical protein CYMTET_34621 [Cymbomonas tetramitiformis]|uniref:Uncharacterized protein n=1 Tax=Cymbomonas tetramitiformis TaxID=36881 RepID=A0AAE0KPS7_9CHLO|nr:hypothetical protein CYMTET_34621 [Cymbomonas tetramitiformis]
MGLVQIEDIQAKLSAMIHSCTQVRFRPDAAQVPLAQLCSRAVAHALPAARGRRPGACFCLRMTPCQSPASSRLQTKEGGNVHNGILKDIHRLSHQKYLLNDYRRRHLDEAKMQALDRELRQRIDLVQRQERSLESLRGSVLNVLADDRSCASQADECSSIGDVSEADSSATASDFQSKSLSEAVAKRNWKLDEYKAGLKEAVRICQEKGAAVGRKKELIQMATEAMLRHRSLEDAAGPSAEARPEGEAGIELLESSIFLATHCVEQFNSRLAPAAIRTRQALGYLQQCVSEELAIIADLQLDVQSASSKVQCAMSHVGQQVGAEIACEELALGEVHQVEEGLRARQARVEAELVEKRRAEQQAREIAPEYSRLNDMDNQIDELQEEKLRLQSLGSLTGALGSQGQATVWPALVKMVGSALGNSQRVEDERRTPYGTAIVHPSG